LLERTHLLIGIELRKSIFEDAPDVVTVINISKYTKPEADCETLVKVAHSNYSYSSIDNGEWEIHQNVPYSTFTDNADKKINLRRNFKLDWIITILRTFFEAEAETRIPPLVFASVMMLKPAFHRWRFKIVRTVVIKKVNRIDNVLGDLFQLKQGTKPYGDKNIKPVELLSKERIDWDWEPAINGRNIS